MTKLAAEHRSARMEVDVESYLSVGCSLVFHADPFHKEAPRYSSILRGWRKPNYMLIDRPKIAGRYAVLRESQPCAIRFVYEGNACSFDSAVLDWDTRQYNSYCRVMWPRAITILAFRKTERVKTGIACKIKAGNSIAEGIIRDLSIGGCCVQTTLGAPTGAKVVLSFTLTESGNLEQVESVVRSVRQGAEDFILGCQFCPDQVVVENEVAFFVMSSLNRTGRADAGTRILIIDKDTDESIMLKQLFEQEGFETMVVGGTLEGLARLRVASPSALVINQQQQEMPGVLVAKMVRNSPGYESLPIFVLNADESAAAEANEMKFTKLFDSAASKVQVVQMVLQQSNF